MSVVCCLATACSLCISTLEHPTWHVQFVGWMFGTLTTLQVLASFVDVHSTPIAVASVLLKARFVLDPYWDAAFNTLEAVDVLLGVAFVASFAWWHSSKLEQTAFGVVSVS